MPMENSLTLGFSQLNKFENDNIRSNQNCHHSDKPYYDAG